MKTNIKPKQIKMYVLIALITGVLFSVFKELVGLVAYLQFFVGVIQVFIAFFKTTVIYIEQCIIPLQLKYYWITMVVYFVTMELGGIVLNRLGYNHDLNSAISLFYLGLAWGIAIYHFKHIMFLKAI